MREKRISCLNMGALLQSSAVAAPALASANCDTGSQTVALLLRTGWSSLVNEA